MAVADLGTILILQRFISLLAAPSMNFDDVPSSIVSLDDDAVEQFLFDYLERKIGCAVLHASDYTLNRTFPPGYRMLTPTVWIEAEMSNGGAGQYFWNRLVDYRPMTTDAIDGYEMIGAAAQAQAVRDCLRVFAPLENKCRAIKNQQNSVAGFQQWQDVWDAIEFREDAPLFDYAIVTAKHRVPWIRDNVELFVFPT